MATEVTEAIDAVFAQLEDLSDKDKIVVLHYVATQVRDRLRPANVNAPKPRALAISNGDSPPCYALKCPACGSIDDLRAAVLGVTVTRGKVRLDMAGLVCNECETWLEYPTAREVRP